MAKYNFEGDISNISERQLEYINNVILEQGFEYSKISFKPVGEAGDNYIASVKRITLEAANGNFTMVAKIAPTLETVREAMNTLILFQNEHLMYTEVLPKLVQLQKDEDIKEENQLRYAKCYGSNPEQPHEVILLEDLKMSDFKMLDRFVSLSSDCVESVLKNFAVLHSLSFVLRHKEPETYSYFKNSLNDVWKLAGKEETLKLYLQVLENDTLEILEDPKHIEFLRHKVANSLNLTSDSSKNDDNNKYTIIQQGDSWTNNIMFKFKEENLIQSVMIDYQFAKDTSPVWDIMYMIFNCTDHEIRRKNFYCWIDYYYTELEKSLSNFNLKANLVYPRDRLHIDLKLYAKVIFGLSILLASILIRKGDDATKFNEAMKSNNAAEQLQLFLISTLDEDSKRRYKKRVIGLIESFTELKLI